MGKQITKLQITKQGEAESTGYHPARRGFFPALLLAFTKSFAVLVSRVEVVVVVVFLLATNC